MAERLWPLTGPPGTPLTVDNAGSTPLFTIVGAPVFDASGVGVVATATGVDIQVTPAANSSLMIRALVDWATIPSGGDFFAIIVSVSTGTGLRFIINSLGDARIHAPLNGSTTATTNAWTNTGVDFPLGPTTIYLYVKPSTNGVAATAGGNGEFRVAYFEEGTALTANSGLITNINTANALGSFTRVRFPVEDAPGERVWGLGLRDETDAVFTTSWPYSVPNTAPSVTIDAPKIGVEPWDIVPHNATPSDTEGGTLTTAWTVNSVTPVGALATADLVGASTTAMAYEMPPTLAGATITTRATTTDTGGLAGFAQVTDTGLFVSKRKLEAGGVQVPVRRMFISAGGAVAAIDTALGQAATRPVRFVFMGDSITGGTAASTVPNRYVNRTITALQTAHPNGGTEAAVQTSNTATFTAVTANGVQGYNTGQAGADASNFITAGERTLVAALNPDVIVIAVGTNDYRLDINPTTYRTNLDTAIADLDTKIGHRPLYVLVNLSEPFDATTLDALFPWPGYGTQLAALANTDPDHFVYVDMTPEFALRGVPGADPQNLISTDDLHPTDAGHLLISQLLVAGI